MSVEDRSTRCRPGKQAAVMARTMPVQNAGGVLRQMSGLGQNRVTPWRAGKRVMPSPAPSVPGNLPRVPTPVKSGSDELRELASALVSAELGDVGKAGASMATKTAKSVSKAQQRFMGMVHAVQQGKMSPPSKEVAQTARSISKSDAEDFAETRHKGLPEHKSSALIMNKRASVRLMLNYALLKQAGCMGGKKGGGGSRKPFRPAKPKT